MLPIFLSVNICIFAMVAVTRRKKLFIVAVAVAYLHVHVLMTASAVAAAPPPHASVCTVPLFLLPMLLGTSFRLL